MACTVNYIVCKINRSEKEKREQNARKWSVITNIFSSVKYGIGCFSKEAYTFVDQLKEAGQKSGRFCHLVLPGYGDSPYQSFSTFAGNPYFIDLESLIKEGLLTEDECDAVDFGNKADEIDYEKMYFNRFELLRKAYERFSPDKEYEKFIKENEEWLTDYCLYMAIKDWQGGVSWIEWEEGYRNRLPEYMKKPKKELKDEIGFTVPAI